MKKGLGVVFVRQINSQLTRDKVVAELRRDILYGVLPANQELYQDKIAEELGVSRMPVREALQILHNEGLVNVRPNKVATVNDISEKFIRDHFFVRSLLEKEAIGLAVDAKPDCAALWENYRLAEEAIARRDFRGFNDYNRQIHQLIWSASGNVHLEKLLSQMWNTISTEGDLAEAEAKRSNADHRRMIECIQEGDRQGAMEAVQAHVQNSCTRALRRFSTAEENA